MIAQNEFAKQPSSESIPEQILGYFNRFPTQLISTRYILMLSFISWPFQEVRFKAISTTNLYFVFQPSCMSTHPNLRHLTAYRLTYMFFRQYFMVSCYSTLRFICWTLRFPLHVSQLFQFFYSTPTTIRRQYND